MCYKISLTGNYFLFRFIDRITSSVKTFILSLVSAPYKVYFLRSSMTPWLLSLLLRPRTYDALTSNYLQSTKSDLNKDLFSTKAWLRALKNFWFHKPIPDAGDICQYSVSEQCLWAPVNAVNFYRSLNSLCRLVIKARSSWSRSRRGSR